MVIPDFQKLDKWEYLIFKSWINGKTPTKHLNQYFSKTTTKVLINGLINDKLIYNLTH